MSKYNNKKTLIDGFWFDSKKEANRYQDLVLMQKAKTLRIELFLIKYSKMLYILNKVYYYTFTDLGNSS